MKARACRSHGNPEGVTSVQNLSDIAMRGTPRSALSHEDARLCTPEHGRSRSRRWHRLDAPDAPRRALWGQRPSSALA